MTTVKLNNIEAAALEVLAEHGGVTPSHLLQDLIRDAAISLVTGRPRRWPGDVRVTTSNPTDQQAPPQEAGGD